LFISRLISLLTRQLRIILNRKQTPPLTLLPHPAILPFTSPPTPWLPGGVIDEGGVKRERFLRRIGRERSEGTMHVDMEVGWVVQVRDGVREEVGVRGEEVVEDGVKREVREKRRGVELGEDGRGGIETGVVTEQEGREEDTEEGKGRGEGEGEGEGGGEEEEEPEEEEETAAKIFLFFLSISVSSFLSYLSLFSSFPSTSIPP
jgi:hypothetical protein